MQLKPLLDGVANGDLVFRKGTHHVSLYSFDCTFDFYDRMADPDLGDCFKCPFFDKQFACTLPSPSQLKHHIPYLREHHPELFI